MHHGKLSSQWDPRFPATIRVVTIGPSSDFFSRWRRTLAHTHDARACTLVVVVRAAAPVPPPVSIRFNVAYFRTTNSTNVCAHPITGCNRQLEPRAIGHVALTSYQRNAPISEPRNPLSVVKLILDSPYDKFDVRVALVVKTFF